MFEVTEFFSRWCKRFVQLFRAVEYNIVKRSEIFL